MQSRVVDRPHQRKRVEEKGSGRLNHFAPAKVTDAEFISIVHVQKLYIYKYYQTYICHIT